jgi:hypothetical protein
MGSKGARRRIRLIHPKPTDAAPRIATLRAAGYAVAYGSLEGMPALRSLGDRPPAAFVIDLSRLPSHGREVGMALRHAKATRHVPLVFVDGAPEKVQRVRRLLPDATYSSWPAITGALRRAMAHPPTDPVVPQSILAAYSGTPLPKKLGISAGCTVVFIAAPADFERTLGAVPEGTTLRRQDRGERDLTIWFVTSRAALDRGISRRAKAIGDGGLWIAWPKRASGRQTDLTQQDVRRVGLAAGLVDYKICAIDSTWSGLKFSRRKT